MLSDKNELAEKYISDHNNPITKKIKLSDSKLFLSKVQDEEQKEKCLTELKNSFKHSRVDRREVRATAEWIPDKKVAKVTKKTRALNKSNFGTFLSPEETLLLLETNRLDLTRNKVSVSIEEAYKYVNFEKYLAYKHLALNGYKLKLPKGDPKVPNNQEKALDEPPCKIAKIDNIFENLRENGPKLYEPNAVKQPDYDVQFTNGKAFGLVVDTNTEFQSSNSENMHAVVADDNVAFYKFYNTNIPIL